MEYTPVHNRFWADGWVRQLNALDRYLFLYLLTNGRAKLTGVYELPIDLMASESGIDEKDLRISMLQRLEPKIYYKEGWVIIINYQGHSVNSSPDYRKGVGRSFYEIPTKIREIALSYGYVTTHPLHTLPPPTRDNRIEEKRREENIADAVKTEKVYIQEISSFEGVSGDSKSPRISGDKRKAYDELIRWSEHERGFPFLKTHKVKQYRAFKIANDNELTREQLRERWEEMSTDEFWQKTGFDWMNVVSSFNTKPI